MLEATSIHGEGDKIALPPTALEYLTNSGNDMVTGSPWIFRIGIPNPDYTFPASELLRSMSPPDDGGDDYSDEDYDEEKEARATDAYLDELNHRYLSYTHGTVVEFTQDEGHIGLPQPMAAALLRSTNSMIPTMRTEDPAKPNVVDMTVDDETDRDDEMNVENEGDEDEERTPGHLAWGAFDVPSLPIEVVLVQIPKGKACRLTPTTEAVENGFYNLKDVKMVLEQSLIRTRATLSVGDLVHTWHRGVKYDLNVTEVTPSTYNTVTCINTDIEVEFGQVKIPGVPEAQAEKEEETGYTLGSSTAVSSTKSPDNPLAVPAVNVSDLLEEPPSTQKEGVCTVQIRSGGGQGRRRFDVRKATMDDLYSFATTISGVPADKSTFQLVTRLPRKVMHLEQSLMEQAGISPGQELFMVEIL